VALREHLCMVDISVRAETPTASETPMASGLVVNCFSISSLLISLCEQKNQRQVEEYLDKRSNHGQYP